MKRKEGKGVLERAEWENLGETQACFVLPGEGRGGAGGRGEGRSRIYEHPPRSSAGRGLPEEVALAGGMVVGRRGAGGGTVALSPALSSDRLPRASVYCVGRTQGPHCRDF